MAAEVFQGQPATIFGENDALVVDHDWDKKLPNPDVNEGLKEPRKDVIAALGTLPAKASLLEATEWGPARRRSASAPEYLPEYMQ